MTLQTKSERIERDELFAFPFGAFGMPDAGRTNRTERTPLKGRVRCVCPYGSLRLFDIRLVYPLVRFLSPGNHNFSGVRHWRDKG
jgi:hypothetical protein